MPRAKLQLSSEFPYHVGARSINRDWFSLPMDTVWQILAEQLYFARHAFDIRIIAFVLMSNHFHMILRTPNANLAEAMSWFMRESSRELTRKGNRINQSYGGRYFRSLICSPLHALHVYKYVYANPLRAKIVGRAEDYEFSTLRGLLGSRHLVIPVEEDENLFADPEGTLRWLNRPCSDENWESVRRAARKVTFSLARVDREANDLEFDML